MSLNGVFAVHKPLGLTSQTVVGKLKHILTPKLSQAQPKRGRGRKSKFIKIGHGGTLDPLAEGVLVIGVGTGTKQLQSYLGQCEKIYRTVALFGASTTTYDSEGAILSWGPVNHLSQESVEAALTHFKGEIKQIPPVFSALKMDGKPLYEYAREGKPLPREIEPRECKVDRLLAESLRRPGEHDYKYPSLIADDNQRNFAETVTGKEFPLGEQVSGPSIELDLMVSSGTYIRSLVHDIGLACGTQAHMASLVRTRQGKWELGKNVLALDVFEKENYLALLEQVLQDGPIEYDWGKSEGL